MRATVELDPVLMRAAKARSAERGESLRSLLSRAVAAELGVEGSRPAGARVKLPLFGRPGTKRASPSNADLEAALAKVDGVRVTRRSRT